MNSKLETVVFAGGCFWCTEAVFQRLKGIASVTSGYANGKTTNPTYEDVTTGETGFAEAVKIEFDPSVITYQKLLDIFWATHDPTTPNRQGSDIGTEYRSAIYFTTEEQKDIAEKSKENEEKKDPVGREFVTEIAPLENFYTAEEYHQNYYERNLRSNPYCSIVISPKVRKLLDKFGPLVKDEYQTT